jgi:hypothetical protein
VNWWQPVLFIHFKFGCFYIDYNKLLRNNFDASVFPWFCSNVRMLHDYLIFASTEISHMNASYIFCITHLQNDQGSWSRFCAKESFWSLRDLGETTLLIEGGCSFRYLCFLSSQGLVSNTHDLYWHAMLLIPMILVEIALISFLRNIGASYVHCVCFFGLSRVLHTIMLLPFWFWHFQYHCNLHISLTLLVMFQPLNLLCSTTYAEIE